MRIGVSPSALPVGLRPACRIDIDARPRPEAVSRAMSCSIWSRCAPREPESREPRHRGESGISKAPYCFRRPRGIPRGCADFAHLVLPRHATCAVQVRRRRGARRTLDSRPRVEHLGAGRPVAAWDESRSHPLRRRENAVQNQPVSIAGSSSGARLGPWTPAPRERNGRKSTDLGTSFRMSSTTDHGYACTGTAPSPPAPGPAP